MKYVKLMRFHSYYIFGKLSSIIFGVVVLIFVLLFILSSGALQLQPLQDLNRVAYAIEYKSTMILAVKMIGTLMACYMFGYNFLKTQDTYYVFCLGKHITKKDYIITKMITILFVYVLFIVMIAFMYVFIGLIGTPWFYITFSDFVFFLAFCIQGIAIGIVTAFLTLYVNNLYVGLISYGVFILNEILMDSLTNDNQVSSIVKIIRFVLPSIITNESHHFLMYGYLHALCLLILYFCIFTNSYLNKDLSG